MKLKGVLALVLALCLSVCAPVALAETIDAEEIPVESVDEIDAEPIDETGVEPIEAEPVETTANLDDLAAGPASPEALPVDESVTPPPIFWMMKRSSK